MLSLGSALGACASLTPDNPVSTVSTAAYPALSRFGGMASDPVPPRFQPPAAASPSGRYKVGAPYQAGGVWYVPAEQPNYVEEGLASWYGDAFDHKPTANGEMFDMRAISAAHATLPMPCMVEVTNLENGRVLTVRMNDRGPFHPGRIIDLSRGAADQLGFAVKGTAKVRVRYVGPAPLGAGEGTTVAAAPAYSTPPPALARSFPTYQIVPPHAPQPMRQAASTPATASAGGAYMVQAGAFSTRNAADNAASRLASAGSTAVRPLDRGGATLYRVVVGPWMDSASASEARGRVIALGFTDARVSAGS